MSTTIDREKECPFLLRIFTRNNGHHALNDFQVNSVPTSDELQLYTWKNATLEELAQLIQEVIPEAQHPDARIAFRLIYLDSQRAAYRSRDLGRVMNIKPTQDQSKTLEDCNFYIGDYLDVAIFIGPPPARNNNQRRNSDWGRDRRQGGGGRFGGGGGGGGGRFRRDDRSFGGGRHGGDRY
ncbi:Sin3 associated polypeptide p18-domain-containing protein [Phascolomyces articulosus]|uniref:Sin3 associated polypeptide p18-domain-containing protein n=1 Tax=Phascolomyces articulosus TaxID=60185 RepID=A0AAD5P7Z4_9FUNG|nr:Sin3 associated polypeptide p18-domain-containing protein [Phascolomyces articulosus]